MVGTKIIFWRGKRYHDVTLPRGLHILLTSSELNRAGHRYNLYHSQQLLKRLKRKRNKRKKKR